VTGQQKHDDGHQAVRDGSRRSDGTDAIADTEIYGAHTIS